MHSYTSSISLTFLSHTHSVTHTHAIKQSASDQSQCCLRTPPPSAPSSVGCKHIQAKAALKTRRQVTTWHLTLTWEHSPWSTWEWNTHTHTDKATWAPRSKKHPFRGEIRESSRANRAPPHSHKTHTLHNSTPPHPHPFSSPPYSCIPNTYQCLSNLSHIPKVDRSLCVCVSAHLYVHLEILVFTVPLSLCVPAWAVQRQLKANSGILNGSKWDAVGYRWRQLKCVLSFHVKPPESQPKVPLLTFTPTPPTPFPFLPLSISQYKGKNEKKNSRGRWMR